MRKENSMEDSFWFPAISQGHVFFSTKSELRTFHFTLPEECISETFSRILISTQDTRIFIFQDSTLNAPSFYR